VNNLRTAQVCVIDDEPREYRRLLRALNSLRLGCVHIAGDKVEDLPTEPFCGLRLVFLDMHLGTHGGMEARAVTAHTANVFTHVVSPNSAPIVVIVWTKYAHLIASFRDSLFEAAPDFRGRLFFVRMDKPQRSAQINVEELRKAIEAEIDKLYPLPLMWTWDAFVQRAACGATAELCRLAATQAQLTPGDDENQERTKMVNALTSVLTVLLRAEAGMSASPELAASTLLDVLIPLHSDRLENFSGQPELESARALLESNEGIGPASADVIIGLNTMLLTGAFHAEGEPFRPGTVYHICNANGFKNAVGFSVEQMAAALCQKDLLKIENVAKLQEWIAACRPIVVEMSPACDFAQRKRPIARFVAGFLVPPGQEKHTKERPTDDDRAIRALRKVKIPALDQEAVWLPIFSSALVLAIPEKLAVPFFQPIARLKEPVLSDLRNWLSGQGARTGYLCC
jgi:hypothetical protein